MRERSRETSRLRRGGSKKGSRGKSAAMEAEERIVQGFTECVNTRHLMASLIVALRAS